jgi:hypothetical protein
LIIVRITSCRYLIFIYLSFYVSSLVLSQLQEQFQRAHAPTEEEEDGRGPAVPIEAVHGMQHHIQTVPKVQPTRATC